MRRIGRGASVDSSSFDDVSESGDVRQLRNVHDPHRLTTANTAYNGSYASRETLENYREKLDPSPTGYRDYTPPVELLQNSRFGGGHSSLLHRYNDDDDSKDDVRSTSTAYSIGKGADVQKKEETFTHKTILLGDSGVGKTSLLVQFDTGRFQPGNFAATVGIGFTNKMITVDDSRVKLQIWDTAGQERFRSVTHAYYRDAHALLLLYDVTSKTSYDNIRAWLGEIREYAHDDVVIMLLGNKCDCGNERVVKREDGERLAREHNVPFMETSAKTGLNVELAFFAVARHLKARKSGDSDTSKFNVQDYVKRQQSQEKSCFNHNCSTT